MSGGGRINNFRTVTRGGHSQGYYQRNELTLTGFHPRIFLVYHVDAAFAAHDAAIFIAALGRLERTADFHT